MAIGLTILAVFVAGFAMIAKRLSSTIVTAPMIFVGLGFAMSTGGLLPPDKAEVGLHIVRRGLVLRQRPQGKMQVRL